MQMRRVGSAVVAAVGVAVSAVPAYHLSAHPVTLPAVAGDVVPFLFGLALFGVGAWLRWGADDAVAATTAAFWVVAGLLLGGGVSAYLLFLHVWHGHVVQSPLFLVYDFAATGAVVGLGVSRYDVRSKRRTARLRDHERRFRAVFEGTLDALVIADDERRYVSANPSAATLFGVSRSELRGRTLDEFLPDDADVDAEWATFLERGEMRGETRILRPDGEVRTVEFAATAHVRPGRHLSVLRDVTPRVDRERALDAERARLDFLNRLLRHHVLNDMNLVLAKLDAVATAAPDDADDDVALARRRCTDVVDLVRTVRRLTSDASAGESRTFDLVPVVEGAIETARRAYPSVRFDVSCPSAVRATADETLTEAFDRLLAHAAEHNDAASPQVSVAVEVDGETVTITVTDNGSATARGDASFSDGSFARAREWGGFDLGLVHLLVEEYGGHLRLDADDGVVSGVVVELPLADEE
ncbi:MAG: PAS domain S-box protein [Haloplanus sp.]